MLAKGRRGVGGAYPFGRVRASCPHCDWYAEVDEGFAEATLAKHVDDAGHPPPGPQTRWQGFRLAVRNAREELRKINDDGDAD